MAAKTHQSKVDIDFNEYPTTSKIEFYCIVLLWEKRCTAIDKPWHDYY